MLAEYRKGWQRFWALSLWWKGPILGVTAFIVLIVGIAVASGGGNNDMEGQEPTPTATAVTPTSSPSLTMTPTESPTPEPTPTPSPTPESTPTPEPTQPPAESDGDLDALRAKAEALCPAEFLEPCSESYITFATGSLEAALCITPDGKWFMETPQGAVGDACSDADGIIVAIVGGE